MCSNNENTYWTEKYRFLVFNSFKGSFFPCYCYFKLREEKFLFKRCMERNATMWKNTYSSEPISWNSDNCILSRIIACHYTWSEMGVAIISAWFFLRKFIPHTSNQWNYTEKKIIFFWIFKDMFLPVQSALWALKRDVSDYQKASSQVMKCIARLEIIK